MFQADPVIWLQSFESPGLNWLMITISNLGYSVVYGVLMTCLIFGYRLKQGLCVAMAAFLVGVLTFGLKNGFEFPRPSHIDVRVEEPGQVPITPFMERGGGAGFWSLPSPEALETVRRQQGWSYGLPSGHVSAAAAFFLGMAFFLRSRPVFVFSAVWVPLMALSRMYLGRHFLGDVLGGIIVGVTGVLIAYLLLRPLIRSGFAKADFRSLLPLVILIVPLSLLAPFVGLVDHENMGRLFALLLLFAYLLKTGFPADTGSFRQRALRVIVVFVLSLVIDRSLNFIMEYTGWEDLVMGEITTAFLTISLSFILSIKCLRYLRLYTREPEAPNSTTRT